MYGTGLLKGLGITLKHVTETFRDDRKSTPSRYEGSTDLKGPFRIMDQPIDQEGILTIQYPEERRLLPERFRYIPMLIWDTEKEEDKCTACGICAKVCPPQCIWIVRDSDENGKPVARPAEFYIDAAVCMSCSFCVEFCPFDAIKMNHDYELAVYDRYPHLVYDKAELTVPVEYYAALWPTQFGEEERLRLEKEEADRIKAEEKARKAADKAAGIDSDAKDGTAKPKRTPEELQALKEKAAAKAKARVAEKKGTGDGSDSGSGDAGGGDDEAAAKKARIEALKKKAQEKAAARKAEADE